MLVTEALCIILGEHSAASRTQPSMSQVAILFPEAPGELRAPSGRDIMTLYLLVIQRR